MTAGARAVSRTPLATGGMRKVLSVDGVRTFLGTDESRAGRGRPWGRVARVFLRSKGKVSEWRNFGVEWLLGAANGDEPVPRIHETQDACT
jgi:hypothetical protein